MKLLQLEITHPVGLYATVARELVTTTMIYQSDIALIYDGKRVNLKSMMSVLSLGIPTKACIQIEIEGKDEVACYQALVHAIGNLDMCLQV